MTPDETAIATKPEAEEETASVEAAREADEATDDEEDFSPLGHIEGWSAFECSSGPFGHRG